jgi:hypothetical protein
MNVGTYVRSLDFGLRPIDSYASSLTTSHHPTAIHKTTVFTPTGAIEISTTTQPQLEQHHPNSNPPYGSQWKDRFLTTASATSVDLPSLTASLPNLKHLSLAGSQILDPAKILSESLANLANLQSLDISYTSLKGSSLDSILCGGEGEGGDNKPDNLSLGLSHTLTRLDVSGLYRFRRNPVKILVRVVERCTRLKELVALNCPDISREVRRNCFEVNPDLRFVWSDWSGGGGTGRVYTRGSDESECDDEETDDGCELQAEASSANVPVGVLLSVESAENVGNRIVSTLNE